MNTLSFRSFVLVGALAFASACEIKAKDPLPAPPAAKVDTFTVTPSSVAKPGDMVTVTWATSNASNGITIEQVGVGPVATAGASGSTMVPVQLNSIFVITARGEGGSDALSRAVTVGSVAGDVIFAALPGRIASGETVTLTWFAPGAQAVSLTEVGGSAIDIGTQKENGTVTLSPPKSTSWRLTADARTATAAVVVKPVVNEFSLASTPPVPGGMLKLAWRTSGAESLVLKRAGTTAPLLMEMTAANVASGEFTDTAPSNLPTDGVINYTLEATAGTVTVSTPLTVYLAGALRIQELNAPPYAKANSDVSVSWRTQGAASVRLLVDGALRYQSTTQANTDQGNYPLRMGSAPSKITLIARNAFGGEVQRERTIGIVDTVGALTFTVTPTALPSGGAPVTLTWSAPGARRVRVVENGLLPVAQALDLVAESGTAQAWPNTPTTTYELYADNTVDPPLYAKATVSVAAPVTMYVADGGDTVFTNQGTIDVLWNVDGGVPAEDGGTEVVGFPLIQTEVDSPSGFEDISLTGNVLTFPDPDASNATFSTDFNTVLGGRPVDASSVIVNTNGYFAFSPTLINSDFPTTVWPSSSYERNFIAPYWCDLDLVNTAHWEVRGTSPNRRLIVQWTKAKRYLTPASDLTFQAKVYESGQIDFEYANFVPAGTATHIAGVLLSRGVGGGGGAVVPSSNKRRTFFGPIAAAPNYGTATMNILPTQGYARMPGGGLMQLGFYNHILPGELAISEVMYAPAAPYADAGEWFEVVNRSPRPIDLAGWTVEFGTFPDGGINGHTIASPLVVPAGGVKVLGQSAGIAETGGAVVDYAYGSGFAMSDTSGTIALSKNPVRISSTWTTTSADAGMAAIIDPNPVIPAVTGTLGPKLCRPPASRTFGTQLGSPGTDTTCTGYRMDRVDLKYRDISRGNTPLTFTNFLAPVDLSSAPVTIWGNQVSQVTVSLYGWVMPGLYTGANTTSNKTRPTTVAPFGLISPFWDGLGTTTAPGSGVYVKRFAAGEDPETPGAHWIIQWHRITTTFGVTDDLNFQVKLFDNGTIEYHYGSMESGTGSIYGGGTFATLWLELPDAGAAIALSTSSGTVVLRPTNTLAYRFSPRPQ